MVITATMNTTFHHTTSNIDSGGRDVSIIARNIMVISASKNMTAHLTTKNIDIGLLHNVSVVTTTIHIASWFKSGVIIIIVHFGIIGNNHV